MPLLVTRLMHPPRLILATLLVCACAAQSYSDAKIGLQSSYTDENERRLQQGSGGNAQNSTAQFHEIDCQPNFEKCYCATDDCQYNFYKCECTQCCQTQNLASIYADFVPPTDAPECNTLDPVLPTNGITDCTFKLPVPTNNTFRYQGITPLGCGLSLAWNYKDTDDDHNSFHDRDTVGFHANSQGLYSALRLRQSDDFPVLSLQAHTPYGGYELYADYTQSITSVNMLFADNPESSNNVRSTLSSVPVGLQIDGTAKLPLGASSAFWADEWYNGTAGAPERCVMLGHGCDGTAKLWRLCRLGGYGQADASVRVTLLHRQTGAALGSPAAVVAAAGATTAAPAAAKNDDNATDAWIIFGCSVAICVVNAVANSCVRKLDLYAVNKPGLLHFTFVGVILANFVLFWFAIFNDTHKHEISIAFVVCSIIYTVGNTLAYRYSLLYDK